MLAINQPTDVEARANQAYDALLWALSRPGDMRDLPVPGLECVAESLCDREVGLFSFDEVLHSRLKRTGVRAAALDDADYILVNGALDLPRIAMLSAAKVGTMLYPETAATIIMAAEIGSGSELMLSGPGIAGSRKILLGGIDPSFWTMRERALRYPLGWDMFIIDGSKVIGLPRSTKIEVL